MVVIVGADVEVSVGMSCKAGGSSVDSITALTSSLLTAATCRLSTLHPLPVLPVAGCADEPSTNTRESRSGVVNNNTDASGPIRADLDQQ